MLIAIAFLSLAIGAWLLLRRDERAWIAVPVAMLVGLTTNPPFGGPVLGLDLYEWNVVIFMVVILATALMMINGRHFLSISETPKWLKTLATIGVVFVLVVSAAEVLTTFAECGPNTCPNDGGWDWWLVLANGHTEWFRFPTPLRIDW